MSVRVITAPSTEPVTLALAREQCGMESDDTTLDNLFAIYIAAARRRVEHWTGRKLITQTLELVVDAFPNSEIRLPHPPLVSITSVKYDDTAGVEQTMDAADYTADTYMEPGQLFPVYGTDWPSTIDAPNCVRVRYVAGYGAASDVPEGIRQWILIRVATMRVNREELVDKRFAAPSYVDGLLDEYVVYG